MDYVALLTFRPSVPAAERDEALMRRAAWQYPDGIRVIAEYWPMTDAPQVVTIFSTDDPGALMQLELEWNDVFDIKISPALAADDGLKIGADVYGRLARVQAS
jgi:hypothetical protein